MVPTEQLKQIGLFSDFTPAELEVVAAGMDQRTWKDGEIIIRERTIGEGFHCISSGEVNVCRRQGDQLEIFATLKKGEHFGEISLVDKKPTTADCVAKGLTTTLFLSRLKYRSIIDSHPAIGVKFLEHFCMSLCTRLRATNEVLYNEKKLSKKLKENVGKSV